MLRLERLAVRFGGLLALDDVSLAIAPGEIVGLVGPNGAGKTTLFNAITGLVRPRAGSIAFEGRDLARLPDWRRARLGIGRTFQIPQPMRLTVRENLVVAQKFGAGAVDAARIDAILASTGLGRVAFRDAASDLSLSELKALEVAKALAIRPKLLLLDEVLAGLEPAAKQRFGAMLLGLQRAHGFAMLMIEHDLEAIRSVCPRVAVLDFGRMIADGTPGEVFSDARVVASYTGEARA